MKTHLRASHVVEICFVVLAAIVSVEHSLAQSEGEAASDTKATIQIETGTNETDQKIRSRIGNIFSELETLRAVTVYVGEGVVVLRGEVANEMAAQQAMRLAGRLAGVVTVTDEMSRTLAVSDNVRPFVANLRTKSLKFLKAIPLIGLALLVVAFFALVGNFLARRSNFWRKLAPNFFLAELLSQAIRLVMLLLGIILALNLLGADSVITTILGGAGVIGLAVGFAVRDTIENYISSIMLSLRQPFRGKDHVVINDIEGIVVRLTSRATILMTLDGNHVRIPNASVFKGIILNYSTNPERRFEFELGVDAEDDPVAGMKAGLDAVRALEFVLDDPEPFALIRTVGDSNIVLTFYAWIDQRETNFAKARSLAIRAAMHVLEEQGFTLPEPIYRLRFDSQVNRALLNTVGVDIAGEADNSGGVIKKKSAEHEVEEGDDVLDVSPDKHLEQKVDAEIDSDQNNDLLDEDLPHE